MSSYQEKSCPENPWNSNRRPQQEAGYLTKKLQFFQYPPYVTCSRKKGPSGIFISIEFGFGYGFLSWIDSSACTEYNEACFKEKYCSHVDRIIFRKIGEAIKLHISEQPIAPIATFYTIQVLYIKMKPKTRIF